MRRQRAFGFGLMSLENRRICAFYESMNDFSILLLRFSFVTTYKPEHAFEYSMTQIDRGRS